MYMKKKNIRLKNNFGQNYEVVKLSTLYLPVSGIIKTRIIRIRLKLTNPKS